MKNSLFMLQSDYTAKNHRGSHLFELSVNYKVFLKLYEILPHPYSLNPPNTHTHTYTHAHKSMHTYWNICIYTNKNLYTHIDLNTTISYFR